MSRLFRGQSLSTYLDGKRRELISSVQGLGKETLFGYEANELASRVAQQYQCQTPVICDPPYDVEPPEFQGDVKWYSVKVHVPFDGPAVFLQTVPTHSPLLYNDVLMEDEIVMTYEVDDPRRASEEVIRDAKRIRDALEGAARDIKNHNGRLAELALSEIGRLRQQHQAHEQFLDSFGGTMLRLKRRDDDLGSVMIPVQRKRVRITEATSPTLEPPDPKLAMEDYENILGVISSMVRVFERSPKVFRTMEEEDLRTILLVGLNGLYEGAATGETFNGAGKTDILIRHREANVFIAECLVWGGEQKLLKKIDDQLLTYATWRDTKLALIAFNRNLRFSEVISTMEAAVAQHKQCVKKLPFKHESGCRFLFSREDDPSREFYLTCLAFDVPR